MAFLGSRLLDSLSFSNAEKAFRPWWDNVEDTIVYGLVILSILVFPSSFLLVSTIDCNFCQEDYCDRICPFPGYQDCQNKDDKKFNLLFVKQFCSKTLGSFDPDYLSKELQDDGLYLSHLVAYFPYFLILFSTLLVLIDRPFVMVLFKSVNMDQLHKLLVVDDAFTQKIDKKKETHELMSSLGSVTKFFQSYLCRTVLSLVAALTPFGYFVYALVTDTNFASNRFICKIHQAVYECAGYPVDFFWFVLMVYVVLLGMYCLLNLWNLVWLLLPNTSSLSNLMKIYKRNHKVTELDKLYFRNVNVQLLLGLLSARTGLAYPLRSLALIDKGLNDALVPKLQLQNFMVEQKGPNTLAILTISKGSVLRDVCLKSHCYVSFCLEYHDEVVYVPEFTNRYEARLGAVAYSTVLPLAVSTMINGKIVALKKFSHVESII